MLGSAWFGLFSALMTLAILFLSEIVPKTIGAIYWKALAVPVAYFVNGLIWSLYPIVWLSEMMTKFIASGKNPHAISREELIAIAHLGEQTGQIQDKESRVIRNLLRLENLTARAVMTPRTVIAALPESATVEEVMEFIQEKPFSRIPVYADDINRITGLALRDEILLRQARGEGEVSLQAIKRDVINVLETLSISLLLDRLLHSQQHLAIVIDEFGGTSGLVTLEDLFETLIGVEIVDEMDEFEDMRAMARRIWRERNKAAVGDDAKLAMAKPTDTPPASDQIIQP